MELRALQTESATRRHLHAEGRPCRRDPVIERWTRELLGLADAAIVVVTADAALGHTLLSVVTEHGTLVYTLPRLPAELAWSDIARVCR